MQKLFKMVNNLFNFIILKFDTMAIFYLEILPPSPIAYLQKTLKKND